MRRADSAPGRSQVLVTEPAWLECSEQLRELAGGAVVDLGALRYAALGADASSVRVRAIGLRGSDGAPVTDEPGAAGARVAAEPDAAGAHGAALHAAPGGSRATVTCALLHEVTALPVWTPRKSI